MRVKKLFSAKDILSWRSSQLSLGGRSIDLDWLLDIGGGLGWESLQKLKIFQNSQYELHKSLEDLAIIWAKHLKDQIPLQQLVGKCPWRDFEIEINSSVLIPRQETEILIELVLEKFRTKDSGCWVDLGTGSGVLAIGLARSLPSWTGYAVDCSEDALKVAARNLELLNKNKKVNLYLGNWWEPLISLWGSFDLVLANPPYIPTSIMKELHPIIKNHEPHIALCGGEDGMDSIREIIRGACKGLRKGGWLIFEHHHDQSERALKYLIENGFDQVDFQKDLEGVRRFAMGRLT